MRILLALVFILGAQTVWSSQIVIHAGKLFDSVEGEWRDKQTIYVSDDRITSVADGFNAPAVEDTFIDLSEAFVLPGLMDMHVHISYQRGPGQYQERFTLNQADIAYNAQAYAKRTLAAGFTTVRSVGDARAIGDWAPVTVALKKAIDKGLVEGPRVYTAGRAISVTGGHFDATSGLSSALMADPGPKLGVVNGSDEARKAVRQRYKEGADLIKIAATGGMLSTTKDGRAPQFADDELRMIVSTAHDYGLTVAAHAHGSVGIMRAVKAGVDSIEHGTEIDKPILREMKKQGTYLVPTMMAPDFAVAKAQSPDFFPPMVRAKIFSLDFNTMVPNMVKLAYDMGVNIAFGSDSGVTPHGDNAREFVLMSNAGIDPITTLQSATINSARLLKIDDQLGSIEPGKLADIVAVPADPNDDMAVMHNVTFIMKNGVIFSQ